MKKIFILISVIALAASCTLEEKVISNSTPATYYQTVAQCKTGINGCYIPLKSLYRSADYFEACEVASDIINRNTASCYDGICDYTQSQPRFASSIWNQGYLGVMRCNAMYAAIERAPLTDEEKAPLFAECVILRAYYYYILTINFGNVPYYFEEVTDANNDRISQLPRMSAEELRNHLIDELWHWLGDDEEAGCQKALPYIRTYDPLNDYRIGSMVGFVLAGKMAMWNKRWADAIKFFSYIEQVYGYIDPDASIGDEEEEGEEEGGSTGSSMAGYTPLNCLLGYKLTDVMFRNRYTDESIFELPAYAREYGLRVTSGLAVRCMPPRKSYETDEEDEFISEDDAIDLSRKDDVYDGVRIPELGGEARMSSTYKPTPFFYNTLMKYNSKDKRRAVYDVTKLKNEAEKNTKIEGGGGWLAWCYSGYAKDDNINDPNVSRRLIYFGALAKKGTSGQPYLGDKFWCPNMVYTQDSNNLKIFRFATVVLDLAECHIRMGNKDLANGYLNAVKTRAGIDTVNLTDEEAFMVELQNESARELLGEFTRRHNLVRWGIFQENIAKNASSSRLKTNVAEGPCREYYPIPDKQIILSNYALDNNEYTKYGL